jgi:hypothetical protein
VTPDDSDQHRLASVRAFEAGGLVAKTGIALVHEGEYILPAPGSEARITTETSAGEHTIHYYFPVEIEVIGTLGRDQLQQIAEHIYRELRGTVPV